MNQHWNRSSPKTVVRRAEQMIKDQMERIYQTIPKGEIPWDLETPPDALVDLVEQKRIRPCRTIDLGCGTGNYALYLASKGFDVTGVDISSSAIGIAKVRSLQKGFHCHFIAADLLGDLKEIDSTFDFAFDWELLHHIFPSDREKYVQNVFRLLNPEGSYLSVCFSEKDKSFGGTDKFRKTPLGTTLYFSSESELKLLFESHFKIEILRAIEIEGKTSQHMANYVFMTRSG
jgi:2-polyprenyl-3-methyl-5-hydroxy-6-metoxy-1,4-benzoquinol methylase